MIRTSLALRNGLTLIELVAALALLAVIVTASLPVLQRAATSLHATGPTVVIERLGALADRIVTTPDEFDIDSFKTIERIEVSWPADMLDAPPGGQVVVEVLRCDESDHGWLRVSVDHVATARWLQLGNDS